MPTHYVKRSASLDPNETSRPNANVIRVDSDDDQLKFTTGTSGTTEVDVVTETQTQTLTNKTLTSPAVTGLTGTLSSPTLTTPTISGNVTFDESTADLTLAVTDQTAAATVTLPDLNGVGAGAVMASTMKFDVTDGHDAAVGTSTGTIEIPAGAVILDIQVVSTVVWNAGTSTVIDVGDDDDPDGWFSQVNLQAAGELNVGETLSAAASGDGTNAPGRWGGANGAYLVEATGRMGQAVAAYSGNYSNAASEVIGALTTVGTVPTTGTTYLTVFWAVPTQTAATYVAT